MNSYLLIYDARSNDRWMQTHESVRIEADSPMDAVKTLLEVATKKGYRVLDVSVYQMVGQPSGGWLGGN